MIENFLTHPLFIASAISFIAGSFSYILVRLWLGPVIRYGQIKRRIQTELKHIDTTDSGGKKNTDRAKDLRLNADNLNSIYYGDLPYWYRLLLQKRKEDPIQAASLLMKLANTQSPDHARRQAGEIKTYLNLKD